MTDISVAMATYNGAKYIRAQLDSIANQTLTPFELVVCDDGSKDDTVSLVQEFANSAPFPVRVHRNEFNLGFGDNFLLCASLCKGGWIAFCDQDDVWMPEKLAAFDKVIRNLPDDLVLVYHSAELVDLDLRPIGRRQPNIPRDETVSALQKPGFWFVGGCVMCFRSDLIVGRDRGVRPRDNYRSPTDPEGQSLVPHDKWICILANASGRISAISGVLAYYRRHECTATDYDDRVSVPARIRKALATGPENYGFLSERAQEFGVALIAYSSNAHVGSSNIGHGAEKFFCLAETFALRSRLYEEARFLSRAKFFRGLVRNRTYWGDPFISSGLKSFIKDFFFVLLGPRAVPIGVRRS